MKEGKNMKLELFKREYEEIEEYTGTDYKGKVQDNKVYVDAECVDEMLWELTNKIKKLKQEKEEIEQDIKSNWTLKGGMLED